MGKVKNGGGVVQSSQIFLGCNTYYISLRLTNTISSCVLSVCKRRVISVCSKGMTMRICKYNLNKYTNKCV